MNSKRNLVYVAFVMVSALFTGFLNLNVAHAAELTKVILAEGMQPPAAPIYVAAAKGFWAEQGLDVELKPFTMGRLCMDAVLGGRADAGFVAELPPVLVAFKDQPFRLIAGMESSNRNLKVLVRKDLGIIKPSDLVGKKVACSVGTTTDYFLSAVLKAKGVDRKQLKVMNLSATDMVTAIVRERLKLSLLGNLRLQTRKSCWETRQRCGLEGTFTGTAFSWV